MMRFNSHFDSFNVELIEATFLMNGRDATSLTVSKCLSNKSVVSYLLIRTIRMIELCIFRTKMSDLKLISTFYTLSLGSHTLILPLDRYK